MKKELMLFSLGILLLTIIPFVSAENIGSFKQGDAMEITNYCKVGTCTYMNLESVILPNGTIIYYSTLMTKTGQDFNYSYTPMELGTYTFRTCGNPGGEVICDSDSFLITPSGNSGNANIAFFILIIILLYGISLFGFFKENAPMAILGGMALIVLGIYMITNGIIIYRDNLTNYIGYITIGWGFVSAMIAIYKEYLENW